MDGEKPIFQIGISVFVPCPGIVCRQCPATENESLAGFSMRGGLRQRWGCAAKGSAVGWVVGDTTAAQG